MEAPGVNGGGFWRDVGRRMACQSLMQGDGPTTE